MASRTGFRKTLDTLAAPALIGAMALILLVPATALQAQQDRSAVHQPLTAEELEAEQAIAEQEAASQAAADDAALGVAEPLAPDTQQLPPPSAHATREAPVEIISLAAQEPEKFIGKTLILDDGTNAITVGPVLDLRQNTRDGEAYLVVDATEYFNSATTYAVAVRDVDRFEDDKIIIPEAPGMHLRGQVYYAEDYTEIVSADVVVPPPTEFD